MRRSPLYIEIKTLTRIMKKNTVSRLAWVSYDFANSAFHLLIPTVLFPLFYQGMLSPNPLVSDLFWSIIVSLPVLIAGISAPFIGAMLDRNKKNKTFFIISTSASIFLTFLLGYISPLNHNYLLLIIFALCMLSFNLSQFTYDAFLPNQIEGKGTAMLSGLGWGFGYLGGILCMLPIAFIIKDKTLPNDYSSYQTCFLIVGLFYLVFSLPSFFLINSTKARKKKESLGISPYIKVFSTIKNWKKNRHIFLFLITFYLINDGLSTLVYFTSIFASKTLQMSAKEILTAFLFVQLIGVPSTIFFCYLSERIGYLKMFASTVILWIFISLGFLIVSNTVEFYVLSFVVGLVIGTTPALGRAILSSYLTRHEDAIEFFGFNAFASRISAVLGPLLFGIISSTFESQKLGLLSLIVFFGLGLVGLKLQQKFSSSSTVYK